MHMTSNRFNEVVASVKGVSPFIAPDDAFSINPRHSFQRMLESLRSVYLGNYEYAGDDLVDAFASAYGDALRVHSIVDVPHDSDESCSIHVLTLIGEPVLMDVRVGDKSDYSDGLQVIDANACKGLLRVLMEFEAREIFQKLKEDQIVKPESMTAIIDKTGYLSTIHDEFFVLNSPKWACGFRSLFKDRSVWAVDAEGHPSRVVEFQEWLNSERSWSGNLQKDHAIVVMEKHWEVIDCKRLLFTIAGEPSSMIALQRASLALKASLDMDEEKSQESRSDRPGGR